MSVPCFVRTIDGVGEISDVGFKACEKEFLDRRPERIMAFFGVRQKADPCALHLPTSSPTTIELRYHSSFSLRPYPPESTTSDKMAQAAATTSSAAAGNILDVLIIGAGWSGLSAALKLSQAGRKVAILEARERIGGRAFTHTWSEKTDVNDNSRTTASPSSSDYWCDFGCSWMHGYLEGSPLKQLTDKYNIPVSIPSPRETVIVGEQVLSRKRCRRS